MMGVVHPASSGTLVKTNGEVHHLSAADFQVNVLRYWQSPKTDALYPSQWHLTVPSFGTSLTIVPNLADQEMLTPDSTNVTYWEGSVALTGKTTGVRVNGRGYVELTGYAGELNTLR